MRTDITDPTVLGLNEAALGYTNPQTGELFVFHGERYGAGPRIEELIHYHTLERLGLIGTPEAELARMRIGGMPAVDFIEQEAENIMRSIGLRPRR